VSSERSSPEPLAGLIGHEPILEGLWSARAAGRLPHALAFVGPAGIGKWRAARRFAQGLLCATADGGPPCGACGPCKRAASDQHPDQLVVDVVSEGVENLRLHRIAERSRDRVPPEDRDKVAVAPFLSLVAAESGARVVLVREVERALVATQNAMLKMLEEPAAGVVWILESSRPADLLPTVRSRVVEVPFAPLQRDETAELLARAGLERERSERLARWSGGSPGAALAWAERSAEELRACVVAALTGTRAPFAAARAAGLVEGRFGGKTPRAEARERARARRERAREGARDAARAAVGVAPSELRHGDLDVPALAPEALETLFEARADVELNVTPEACVERGFLALASARAAAGSWPRSDRGPMLEGRR